MKQPKVSGQSWITKTGYVRELIIIVLTIVIVFLAITWLPDALRVSKPTCNVRAVEQLFTDCKITPSGTR